ncbi:lipase [Corynebacterium sp. 13CS0277]|uniref:lipase family alpha/beta hydrolase n=1 Tax=Corynebacterium sp. 13CS0277 TaxID=2071994 RepID=UPI000D0313D7|nr:triacylglycerol lipase [Corynebacterium sp. 13CS0277]PRQ11498.1 lipase [Corynebacterium sp. 13CS0277]
MMNLVPSAAVSTFLPTRGWFEDDWRARPDRRRPWPVVLIHGTTVSNGDWLELGAGLRRQGWAVFAPAYGHRATNRVADNAAEVAAYCEQVLHATGAEQLIMVGHSQGGLVARAAHAHHGIPLKHLVCLATPNHGTTLGGMLSGRVTSERRAAQMRQLIDRFFGPAGQDQIEGSEFLTSLNAAGETLPGTSYTCIATRTDTTVVPAESCFLDGANNMWVQDYYPRALVLHEQMPFDRRVRSLVIGDIEQWQRLT